MTRPTSGSLAARIDLSRRSTENERLDSPGIAPRELEDVLRDLARFNGVMLGRTPILRWLRRALASQPKGKTVRVVDVGCGYGDLLRAVRRWSRKWGVDNVALQGIDLNPVTVRIARAATRPEDLIDYRIADVFTYRPEAPVDLIVSSLFAHHLRDETLIHFLRWMEATAQRGWLICDLQRHIVPYAFIGPLGKISRVHPVVVSDGRISIARSLTRAEWRERLDGAGIPRQLVTIRWFLFRHVIGRLR
jgi:SAM-dependent methyltransferase